MSGTWCCLCQTGYSNSKFYHHYIEHLEPLIDKEIADWDLKCKECDSFKSEFLNYQNLKSHYIENHFKHKLHVFLADIKKISFIRQLRKEMNVCVLVDIDAEEDDSEWKGVFSKKNPLRYPGMQQNIL